MAVYDGVGKTTFLDGLKALAPTGRMILYGAASGQPDPLPLAMLAPAGSLYVQRPTLQTYTRTPELLKERARGAVRAASRPGRSTSGSAPATRSSRRVRRTRTSRRARQPESCC